MHEKFNSLIHRYARPPRAYSTYYTYYTFEPEPLPQPAMIERRGLRLVVRNDFLPNVTSPHYHTGE